MQMEVGFCWHGGISFFFLLLCFQIFLLIYLYDKGETLK